MFFFLKELRFSAYKKTEYINYKLINFVGIVVLPSIVKALLGLCTITISILNICSQNRIGHISKIIRRNKIIPKKQKLI